MDRMDVYNILCDTVQRHTDLSGKSNTNGTRVEVNISQVTYSGNSAASNKPKEDATYIVQFR
jgi:hypothetical protein